MSLEPGTEFAGYRVVRRIGAGGMGEVYLVRHPRLPRHDVIKVLAEQVSNDPIFRARFTREADLAAQLDHPCIVSVYDRGEVEGRLWISMQYVPGTDAAAVLATSPGGLPLADVAAVGDAIGAALDHAHRSGLLHRDVKPANILISPGESDPRLPQHVTRRRIRLADFGIARPTDGGATSLTSTDLVIGSFPYSSPEQLSAETLDARSDVYSLACSVFELISGTVPFTARTPAMMIHHHLSTPPPELSDLRPDVPRAVSGVVRSGLAKSRTDRPSSAGAFAAELRSAIDSTVFAPAPPRPERTVRGHAAAAPMSGPPMSRPAPPALPPTAFAPTAAIPVTGATRPRDDGARPTIARGATAYSGLPGHAVPQHDPGSSTVRASRDLPVLDPPRPGPGATRRTTASLACGVAAIPLSVVGGLGLPVGVAGWYLAGRGQPGSAGRFARVLCVLGVVLSLGFIAFTVGRAVAMQF
ncbi:serine/threonine-protein kinase [Gordonia sp. UCD-TK1]|uniref:serine/threonine-protein kinase n=1 Tax=Gordonia sp. UCD-TK1 TaxID=1857893 RepID=UPI00080E2230|nr:serine/threonine-protein kinase [Gordonia sp. UCD-TK1]OCH82655.1 serine/threonine protein kinase [Gordonia sp. UCD-TK1]